MMPLQTRKTVVLVRATCPNCGKVLQGAQERMTKWKFCVDCGTKLVRTLINT